MERKRIILICGVFLALAAIGAGLFHFLKSRSMGPVGSKALYIYMCGSTLESEAGAASRNIQELLDAKIPEDMEVIIQTGGTSIWKKHDIPADKLVRYRIANGSLEKLEEQEAVNMGIANTLYEFLHYSVSNYPAEKMGVILWDHGGGGIGGVCNDENYDMDSLSLNEMDTALKSVSDDMTDTFEMIGFDACLMANMETANMVSNYAKNMVASEELEPTGGWDYKSLVSNFGAENGYNRILSDYAKKCETNHKAMYTLSHIDMAEYWNVKDSFSELASKLKETKFLKDVVDNAKTSMCFGMNSEKEGYSNLIDLCDFANSIGVEVCAEAINKSVSCVNGKDKEGAGGLSLYYPLMDIQSVNSYLKIKSDENYQDFIRDNYLNIPEKLIEFIDTGSDKDGELHIELTKDSMKYVQSVEYRLYRFVKKKNEYVEHVICMGDDTDVVPDGENGFTTSFGGQWPVWQGEYFTSSVIDKNGSVTIFATPVKVNGKEGSIRFSYNIDKKSFEILGFIPKNDTGVTERLQTLEPDDTITLLYDERTYSYEETLMEGISFKYGKSKGMELKQFPDGNFQNHIKITDIFGNSYISKSFVCSWKEGKMKCLAMSTDEDIANASE